jgi:hypothetical protein
VEKHSSAEDLFFWLGANAEKIVWYADHFQGLPFKCHTAKFDPDFKAHLPTDQYK